MKIGKKIIIFHFLFFLIFLLAFLWPHFFYYALIAFNLFFLFFILSIRKINIGLRKYLFFILAGLFLNSTFLFLSLLIKPFLIFSILILANLVSYYYFKELKNKLIRDMDLSMGVFSGWIDTIAVLFIFFISSFIYALPYFLNISVYFLILLLALALFVVFWSIILSLGTILKTSVLFSFLSLLALLPITWILFFLPFNYYSLGFILVLCYYLASNLIRLNLLKTLTNKKIKYNLIFFILFLIILLMMIKWR